MFMCGQEPEGDVGDETFAPGDDQQANSGKHGAAGKFEGSVHTKPSGEAEVDSRES